MVYRMSHIALRAYDTKRRIIPARAKKGKVFLENCRFIAVSAAISPTLAPLQAGFWGLSSRGFQVVTVFDGPCGV
jgi:hypothetical protein